MLLKEVQPDKSYVDCTLGVFIKDIGMIYPLFDPSLPHVGSFSIVMSTIFAQF